MALYTVTNGQALVQQDLDQIINLLTGNDQTTQVTVSNGIRAVTPACAAPSRYVGGTTSGAPTSGTFQAGDLVIAQDGFVWVCATAGSPGTWFRNGTGNYSATATQVGAQTLTSRAGQSGFDTVHLDTSLHDPHSMFSAVGHSITIPFSGGTWLVSGTVGTTLAAHTFVQTAILVKNGTAFARGVEVPVVNGGDSIAYDLQQFSSGDVITLAAYAEAAAAVNVNPGHVILSISLIG